MPTHNEPAFEARDGILPCLVHNGSQLEDLPQAEANLDEYYRVNARNALRSLTYGTPLFKGSIFNWPNLKLAWLDFKALFLKRDEKLLAALRLEMKELFRKAYVISPQLNPPAARRLEIFITTLLSNFPFMDPDDGERICLPQRIRTIDPETKEEKYLWRQVSYTFRKIDISPKTGLLSKLIEEEDRIYAYGLEPDDDDAKPYLLLMGTTYFSGQGAGLSLLGDLTPGQSVGERHDLSELEKWLVRHRNIIVTGHSQGGTMAMIVAAKYPEQVLQADCLNPAALHKATLRKLRPLWSHFRRRNPEIRVFTQAGDPVFAFGDGFLPGTRIFRVNHPRSAQDSGLAAHAHHYSGHEKANYTELTAYQSEVQSNKRKFLNDLKYAADRIVGPVVGLIMAYTICKRKLLRFYSEHAAMIMLCLFLAAAVVCVALIASGVLAPAALPLLASLSTTVLGKAVAETLLAVGLVVANALAIYLAPKLIHLAVKLSEFACGLAAACVVGVTLGLSAIVCGIKAGIRSLKRTSPDEPTAPEPWDIEAARKPGSRNQSTRFSLESLGPTQANTLVDPKPEHKRSRSDSCLYQPSHHFQSSRKREANEAAEFKRDLSRANKF